MTSVLDASAGIEVVLNRSRSNEISSVLEVSRKVYSTDLYKAEVTNSLWKYLRAGQISKNDAADALRLALDLVDEFSDSADFANEVLNESLRMDHSTYDIFYMTLARRTSSTLLTLDKKLSGIASRVGIDIIP